SKGVHRLQGLGPRKVATPKGGKKADERRAGKKHARSSGDAVETLSFDEDEAKKDVFMEDVEERAV
ncbi:MAG: hypothetical protein Q9183_004542, partial [Haloplaca sp. 2 TL-2023]